MRLAGNRFPVNQGVHQTLSVPSRSTAAVGVLFWSEQGQSAKELSLSEGISECRRRATGQREVLPGWQQV